MSTTRAVARGTTRLLGGLLSAKALDFVFYLILARTLGVDQFGRYTFALSFTLLFSIVADFGVLTIFTREVSRDPRRAREMLRQTLALKLLLSAATLAASLGAALLTRAPAGALPLVAILTTAMLINSVALLFENLLKAAGRSGSAGLSAVAQSVTVLAVGLTLVFSGFGALGGAIAYLVAALVHAVAAAWWSRGLWNSSSSTASVLAPSGTGGAATSSPNEPLVVSASTPVSAAPQPSWHGPLGLLREAAPLALSGAFIAVYFRIDSVLLQMMQGPVAVGLYGGAYRFFEAFVLFSAAYRSVLFPVMARRADGPNEGLGILCRKSLRLHLMFTVGVAVFVTAQARSIVTLVLGPEYASAAPALAILMWALPGAFMADTLLHLLAAQRRQSVSARAVGITAAFNVTLNLILIPRFSFVGAALVTVGSELLCFGLMYAAFRSTVPKIGLLGVARAPLVAGVVTGAAMALFSSLAPGGIQGIAVMATFAATAYVFALIALGALGREDLELVQELLPKSLRPAPLERRDAA